MLHSTDYWEVRNEKRYQTSVERKMSHHGSTEELVNTSSSEIVAGKSQEIQTLTQEAVNEHIRRFIAPLTRQLEELTRPVQGMSTSRHPNSYPRTERGTTCGTAKPQSHTEWAVRTTTKNRIYSRIKYFKFKNRERGREKKVAWLILCLNSFATACVTVVNQ